MYIYKYNVCVDGEGVYYTREWEGRITCENKECGLKDTLEYVLKGIAITHLFTYLYTLVCCFVIIINKELFHIFDIYIIVYIFFVSWDISIIFLSRDVWIFKLKIRTNFDFITPP